MVEGDSARETRNPEQYREVFEKFEAAWANRSEGSEEPKISDFLGSVPPADHPAVRYSLESLARRLRQAPTSHDASLTSASVGDTLAPDEPARDIQPADVLETPPSPLRRNGTTISPAERDTDAGGATACDAAPGATGIYDSNTRQSPLRSEDFDLSETLAHHSVAPPDHGGIPDHFDEYEIIEELGRGGMGVVYKAREKNTQRLVCLKMILGGEYASPDALRRFQVETEAAAHLDHPNIVPIYRAGVVNGIPYFAMKYVAGKSMDAIDRDEFKADPKRCVVLVGKICRAVAFAHSRGILHRDLKPANILLDQDDEPHVTDFGLAKRMDDDSGQTRTGLIMGTPDYMSPEQAVGNNALVTVTSDVYSLGSILFDLLTGQPPFKSETVVETLTRVTREPARIPTTLHRRVDRDLETICLKCLEKDPGKRYRSAASLADELERFLRSEPIEGRPVGSAERFWRWCRRNPSLASLSAALLISLLLAAVGSTVAAFKINAQRVKAIAARRDEEVARQLADENAALARANAKVADTQRKLALDTLHSLVTKVDEKLRDRADLADLQKDVLQNAFNGLQEVSRTAENSGRADRTVGVAHQRMADILEQLGKSTEAHAEHRKAIDIFEALIADNAKDDWAKWNAAISYDKLGDGLLSTDEAAATEFYGKSLGLRKQLVEARHNEDLSENERQRSLIISSAKLGRLALQKGRPAEARGFFETALQQSEAMLARDPSNQQFRVAVAGSCSLLGRVSFSLGDLPATKDYYRRALELRKQMHAEDPASVSATSYLAGAFDSLGDVELQTSQPLEAQAFYESAVELLEQLNDKDPDNAVVKGSLSTLYYKLATTLLRLNDALGAKPIYAKCLALREELLSVDQDDPNKQIAVLLARARCGRHEEAASLASQLHEKARDNAGSLFYVACGYALCGGAVSESEEQRDPSLKASYFDAALAALNQAVQLGYHDVVALETDPDLDPIRGNKEFQVLIAKLQHTQDQ